MAFGQRHTTVNIACSQEDSHETHFGILFQKLGKRSEIGRSLKIDSEQRQSIVLFLQLLTDCDGTIVAQAE